MKLSPSRHPVAILRQICGLYQKEFADLIGCSRIYLQKIEQTPQHGGQKLSEKLATRIFTETHISLEWLLAGDPKAPPVSAKGEPYTLKIFERAQAEKEKGFFQHPIVRLTNAIGFCAQLVAILESAKAQKKYYMAAYKVGKALDSFRNEFGQNLQIYPVIHSPHLVIHARALEILRQLLDLGQKEVDKSNQRRATLIARRKRPSSQRRKKKRA
jgi:transcriptional regulator with XRE-family HTH domain